MNLGKPLAERKRSDNQIIIGNLVEYSPGDKHFWPREMKLCAKLIAEYGKDFLLWINPPYKVKSLAVYGGAWGKKFLAEQLYDFKRISKPETKKQENTPTTQDEKVGEDAVVAKKPKSLNDFLNLFN